MRAGLQPGAPAPGFDLLAAGSGRRVALREEAGRRVVLIFHQGGNASVAHEVNRAVRARYPDPGAVLVASVIDMSLIPPVYWMAASLFLATAYEQASAGLPEGADPAEYVVILPDWGGVVSRRYGARRTGRAAFIVVVGEGSKIAGVCGEGRPAEEVIRLLERTA